MNKGTDFEREILSIFKKWECTDVGRMIQPQHVMKYTNKLSKKDRDIFNHTFSRLQNEEYFEFKTSPSLGYYLLQKGKDSM